MMTLVAELAFFVCVTVSAFGLAYYLTSLVGTVAKKAAASPADAARPRLWQRLARLVSRRIARLLPEDFVSDVTQQITRAGGLAGLTPAELVVYGGGAGILALSTGLLVVAATGWPLYLVLLITLLGVGLPFIWLRDRVKERQLTILSELPFHLDLLTLCIEAGLDFTAAVSKMVEKGKPGPLRDEFGTFLAELRIGKTRAEALEAMGERVGLPQLRAFLSALIQTDKLGSGLARTLRVQAEQLRTERFQRAETLAGEAPVKMLIPLVLFIFPTIWIILAAPLVFEWIFGGGRV
jgi:tight adherence protein C